MKSDRPLGSSSMSRSVASFCSQCARTSQAGKLEAPVGASKMRYSLSCFMALMKRSSLELLVVHSPQL